MKESISAGREHRSRHQTCLARLTMLLVLVVGCAAPTVDSSSGERASGGYVQPNLTALPTVADLAGQATLTPTPGTVLPPAGASSPSQSTAMQASALTQLPFATPPATATPSPPISSTVTTGTPVVTIPLAPPPIDSAVTPKPAGPPTSTRRTFHLCDGPEIGEAEQSIAQMVGNSLKISLVSVADGCADLTVEAQPTTGAAQGSGGTSSSNISVTSSSNGQPARLFAVKIVVRDGKTTAEISVQPAKTGRALPNLDSNDDERF